MLTQRQIVCDECQGRGEVIPEGQRCETCHGLKLVDEQKLLEVEVTKGMQFDEPIVFRGEADQEPDGPAGDLVFVLKEKQLPEGDPLAKFVRRGNDLVTMREVPLAQALTGFQVLIKHLDGNEYLISHKDHEVLAPDQIRKVTGLGMPWKKNPTQYGDLLVKFSIKFPAKISPKEREAIKKIFSEPEIKVDKKVAVHHTEIYTEDDERNARRSASADEDEEGGAQNVQCAQS